jgi:hypothetical protein
LAFCLTLLVAIVVPLLLPDRFSLTPKWIGPALLTALLVAHTIADPGRIDRQSRASRAIGIALMAVLVAGAATQAVVLIAELVGGNKALNSADALLSSGADLAPPGWRPLFLDYLYLGLTNATAFSPTDVMPLRHWAKLTMGAQALISLIILGLVIARAVNILT